ncbi:peptidoglycan D,D-transpeptidase FtsI family protein [Tepidanaerobacter acetatoxydans]|uniref:peptidoglycan D,D-transpeptidase FtsI family protein n=1 Tax=Tepidanaerobacter acetatoxydans TaxID=499229 RepID=UPI001BD61469|nr:penicillin-binding protein 2 [Tepidanaerobacter acetatoxydans]
MKKNNRILILFFSVAVMCMMLIFRLFYIQIVRGPFLTHKSFLQKTSGVREKVRGQIFDRNGKPLTGTYSSNYAIISPNWLTLSEKQLLIKENILNSIDDDDVKNISVTPENQDVLYDLKDKTPGIFIYDKNTRYGPTALATHVVGFEGETGIEKTFDSFLSSDIESGYVYNDGLGQPIAGLTLNEQMSETWGVKLTIDRDFQKIVEDVMDKSIESGAVVVIEPKSGEILAMASRPNYKQFQLEQYLNQENAPLINRAVESYAPGSIFKIVILSAALEEKITQLDEIFYCPGFEKVGENIFKCSSYERSGHGEITLKDALAFSCNSVFIQLGTRLGKDKILEYARLFGLGEKTLIGLPEEKEGNLPSKDEVFYQDLGNLSIGQGAIGITPIQAAQIILTIVNDGVTKKPILIKEIIDQDGDTPVFNVADAKPERILSSETAKKVREALEAAAEYGTGESANPRNNRRIGGKTGTAEIENQASHAWFVGYYPADAPELVMSVFVEHGGSGSAIAAPIFKEIIERISVIR